MILDGKVILITGGTGSFGKKFTEIAFKKYNPEKIIVFSRDEFKQYEMAKLFPPTKYPIRYFLGDIRDKDRLLRAFENVDFVIHAAAIKQVPAAEYNPFEAVKTNIFGAQNIVDAALNNNVKKVIALSTDKAVSPINLYGATKLSMEKLMAAANSYVGKRDCLFSCVRYGNVVGSRGSVIPFFKNLIDQGETELPITDERMTRFWITLDQGVELVLTALEESIGGETFIPKIPSMKMTDLARAMNPNCTFKYVGIRPGEKIHETLISEDEGRHTIIYKKNGTSLYVILPLYCESSKVCTMKFGGMQKVETNFEYRSDNNSEWLTIDQLKELIKE